MRSLRRILWLVASFAFVTCLIPSASLAGATPRAERPTYTLGEKWLRDDGAYELIRIEDDRYIFVAGPDQVVELTKDLAVAKVQRGQAIDEWSSPPTLTWPLEVGKWGSGTLISSDFVWSIEAYEPVRVPAGTFRAFRVQVVVTNTRSLAGTRTFRLWYAPEARQYVKGDYTGGSQGTQTLYTFQVVALDRPAPAPLQVGFQDLQDRTRVTAAHLPLKGKVTGGKGVARVVVTLNGREVTRHEAKGAPPTEVPLDVALSLQEGKNVLLVTVTDPEGALQQEARTIVYEPSAAVAGTRTATAPAGAPAVAPPPLPSLPTAQPGAPRAPSRWRSPPPRMTPASSGRVSAWPVWLRGARGWSG